MGTNCGLTDPDDLALLNFHANDLGIDTIETGAMMGVLLDAGLAPFGDMKFLLSAMDEIRHGTEKGRLWAQGTARVGEHYKVHRTPVVKKQGISAYDPRVIEVTGITMMITAQGADHTAGNAPKYDCEGKSLDELVGVSMDTQVMCAATDSLGLCLFGRSVTNVQLEMVVDAINGALGTSFDMEFFKSLGRETLRLEDQFNLAAGFSVEDDELPGFFYEEALYPTNRTARFHAAEVNAAVKAWWERQAA
jgi:aldehyde:ferredoxin oxidoreductase